MTIIDITRGFQTAPVYPGSTAPEIERIGGQGTNALGTTSMVKADSHSGTHADAFCHFLPEGMSIDRMPLENYCGKCRVLNVPENALVTLDDIRGKLAGIERVVLHGGGNTFLCEEAAEYLAMCRVKLLVTDAVSVGPADNEASIHRTLFENGVAVVENAVLDGVEEGEYLIFSFPCKYTDCDGAPVRAVLLRE